MIAITNNNIINNYKGLPISKKKYHSENVDAKKKRKKDHDK